MLGVVVNTLPRRHRQAIARVSVSALVASLPLLYVSLLRPPPAALAGDTAFWFLMSNCVIAAIVATADDAGRTLFFGDDRSNDDDHALLCGQPPVFPLALSGNNVPAPAVVTMEGGGEPHDETVITDQSNNTVVMVKGDEEGEEMVANSPTLTPAPDEAYIPVGKQKQNAIVKGDRALTTEPEAEPAEPWVVPKLLTSKSLPDQEEEATADDEEWPLAHDNRGGRLRRWGTDGGKSSVAEESEYWQLSDEELNRRVEDFIARFNRQMRLQIEQEAAL